MSVAWPGRARCFQRLGGVTRANLELQKPFPRLPRQPGAGSPGAGSTLSAPRAFAQSQKDCLLKPCCGLDQSSQNHSPHEDTHKCHKYGLTAEPELRKSGGGRRRHCRGSEAVPAPHPPPCHRCLPDPGDHLLGSAPHPPPPDAAQQREWNVLTETLLTLTSSLNLGSSLDVGSIIVRSSFSSAGEKSHGQHQWACGGTGTAGSPRTKQGRRTESREPLAPHGATSSHTSRSGQPTSGRWMGPAPS